MENMKMTQQTKKVVVTIYFNDGTKKVFDCISPPAIVEGVIGVNLKETHTKFFNLDTVKSFDTEIVDILVQPITLVP
jgi:hypothetical protein